MKNYKLLGFLTLCFLLIMPSTSEAQLLKDIYKTSKKRTKRQIERRSEKRASNAINDGLDAVEDKIFGKKKKKKKSNSTKADDINLETNQFVGSFTMETKVSTGNSYNFDFVFDTYKTKMEGVMPDGMTSKMIIDLSEKTLTTLVDNGGVKQGYKNWLPEGKTDTEYNAEVIKTSEVKIINDYTCRKYLVKDDNGSSEVWVTKDIDINFEQLRKNAKGSVFASQPLYDGFPIEIHHTNNNGSKTVSTIKNVSTEKPSSDEFKNNDYQIVDMTVMERR